MLLKTDIFTTKATSEVYVFMITSGHLPPILEWIKMFILDASFLITASDSQQNLSFAVFYCFKPDNYFILILESFKSSSSFASPLTFAQK